MTRLCCRLCGKRRTDTGERICFPEDCLLMEREALKIGVPAKDYRVVCVGHAHMDMNWTWGYDETVQVVLDTLFIRC